MLREHPEIAAYGDDCTFSISYLRRDHDTVAMDMNSELQAIHDWKVSFAANKTQAMVVSRSPAASDVVKVKIVMNIAIPL